jgi:hypothetical protein
MEQYAASLRDVGTRVGAEHGGSFAALADAAASSAPALADLLAAWPAFADASEYEGRRVPFFKRAQLPKSCSSTAAPPRLDQLLWNRGRGARYKALPRPRCRTTAY